MLEEWIIRIILVILGSIALLVLIQLIVNIVTSRQLNDHEGDHGNCNYGQQCKDQSSRHKTKQLRASKLTVTPPRFQELSPSLSRMASPEVLVAKLSLPVMITISVDLSRPRATTEVNPDACRLGSGTLSGLEQRGNSGQ